MLAVRGEGISAIRRLERRCAHGQPSFPTARKGAGSPAALFMDILLFIAPGALMEIYAPGSNAVLLAIFSLIAETVSVIGRVVVSITFAS